MSKKSNLVEYYDGKSMNYIFITSNHDQENVRKNIETILGLNTEFDYIFLSPKEGKYLIDDVKSFFKKLSLTRFKEKVPVYVVLKADLMQPLLQNTILKILEESKYTIVLTVSNISSIIPTIRSRCVEIVNKSDDFSENIEFDMEKFLKMDRAELIKTLSSFQFSFKNDDKNFYKKILALDRAIRLLQSNCKIEAVLFELNRKIQSSI